MATNPPVIPASRIVVILPNWLGDAVMATPFLRALRGAYPDAHIAAVGRKLVLPVVQGSGLVDAARGAEKGEEGGLARWLRGERFDLGILLPNSFRSAWMLWRGRVGRRLGYARGGRSLLLTDRIHAVMKSEEQTRRDKEIRIAINLLRLDEPVADGDLVRVSIERTGFPQQIMAEHRMRSTGNVVRTELGEGPGKEEQPALQGRFEPMPTIDYYLQLARYLAPTGTQGAFPRLMQLGITEAEAAEAEAALALMGIAEGEEFVMIVPGANFGASKCWMPERFAAVAVELTRDVAVGGRFGVKVVVASSPSEKGIVEAILAAAGESPKGGTPAGNSIHALGRLNGGKGVSVGALKEIVRRSRLMICNDTGPRHFAAAFGVPTVTLFGPTDPIWAETYSPVEKLLRVDVPCGPCQLKRCPIDHRCMKGITVDMVLAAVTELWNKTKSEPLAAMPAVPPPAPRETGPAPALRGPA